MFQGGFVSWFLFSSFLPILIYQLSFILYPVKNWQVTRQFSKSTVRASDSIDVVIEIERKFPFPIYYCVVEEDFSDTVNKRDIGREKYRYLDHPEMLREEREVKRVVFPWFARKFEMKYSLEHVARGKHRWNGVRIKTGDMFGFVKKEHFFPVEDTLHVYPNSLPAHLNGTFGDLEYGTVSSGKSLNQSNMVVGVREYEPGDRFSWIDWKQTAKKNTMMSKEFEREKSTNVTMILDSCSHPGVPSLLYEASIEVTLGLIESFRNKNTKVRMLILKGPEKREFRLQDQGSWRKIIHELTMIQPNGKESFALHLQEQLKRIHKGMILIVTAHLNEELKKVIEQYSQRVAVLLIQSESSFTEKDQMWVDQWKGKGIRIQILTEEQLGEKRLEVDVK